MTFEAPKVGEMASVCADDAVLVCRHGIGLTSWRLRRILIVAYVRVSDETEVQT